MANKFEKLFPYDELFPLISSDEELQQLILKNTDFDPEYITAHCVVSRVDTREWLESLWLEYYDKSEPDFLPRLRSSEFHKMTWQMYVAKVLIDKGYEVLPNSGKGPDIEVIINGKKYWIEAVVTTPGKDTNASGFPASGDIYKSIAPRAARLSNALTEKYNKYKKKYYGKICKVDEPFILAINGSLTETFMPERLLLATVFAKGNDIIDFDTGIKTYEVKDTYQINKDGIDIPIPMDYFCNESYKELSGVIYCEMSIINANNFGREPEKNFFFAVNGYALNQPTLLEVGNICKRISDGTIQTSYLK